VSVHEIRFGHVAQQDIDQYTFSNYYLNVVKAAFITDLEVGYDLTSQIHLAVGADNLFDRYPTKISPTSASFAPSGWNVYDTTSPFGFNGGFYYGRIGYRF
jgi:iron complex outermembrane receptor protein